MSRPLQLLDLFSGIGGWSLGLEATGAFETAAFCEADPFRRNVLAKHWPGVPKHDDIRTLSAFDFAGGAPIDAIAGGFPCQGFSHANSGKRKGLADPRSGLWREFARLIGELRPRVVFMENSANIRGAGLATVLGDLAALGYDAEWHCIPAAAFGARHVRDRLWLAARPSDAARERGQQCWGEQFAQSSAPPRDLCERFDLPEPPRVVDGVSGRLDEARTARNRALGASLVPQVAEAVGAAVLRAWFPELLNPAPDREADEAAAIADILFRWEQRGQQIEQITLETGLPGWVVSKLITENLRAYRAGKAAAATA